MKLFVGTSGYGYKEWKGSFYPEKLPAKQMLEYYGQNFNAVELNNTFRKMPTADSLTALAEQVPEDFQFAVKSPQSITHFKRLQCVDEPLEELSVATAALESRRGPVLFQLPPNFKKDLGRLEAMLKILDKQTRAAFEFRHESWFDDEVFEALKKESCVLCAADDDEGPEAQLVKTADWVYVRLRRAQYTKRQLSDWLKKIQDLQLDEAYVFFKHEETGTGPKFAKTLMELAEA